jgi:TRAP-type mannitol/chloroaromatic compound transport system substrate-binding protein
MLILSDYTLSSALHSGQLGLYFASQTMIILQSSSTFLLNGVHMKRRLLSLAMATTVIAFSGLTSAQAQTKWDLPAAYPASNFHTENLVQFANDVDKATGGKLKITVHANASFQSP